MPSQPRTKLTDKLKRFWQPMWMILSFLVGLGVINIEAFSVKIPDGAKPYVFATIILIGLGLTLYKSIQENEKLLKEIDSLNEKINQATVFHYPSLFIEDIPVQSLIAHVEYRRQNKYVNPVRLGLFEIFCRIVGGGTLKDADVLYKLIGINMSKQLLTGLQMSIAGDNLVPLDKLKCEVYDIFKDPEKQNPTIPRLLGADSIRKDLFLPFLNPGINSGNKFHLEFKYLWPGIFSAKKDYWFLDNIDFEGDTEKIRLGISFISIEPIAVRAYSINAKRGMPVFVGALVHDVGKSDTFTLDVEPPAIDTYYILVFEAKEKSNGQVSSSMESTS